MIFRQAAALALVGWYLMVPPITSVRLYPSSSAGFKTAVPPPLREWSIKGSYDFARDCVAEKQYDIRIALSDQLPVPNARYCSRGLIFRRVHRHRRSAPREIRLDG